MKDILLCGALILLSGCASSSKPSSSQFEAIPSHKIQQKLEAFRSQSGQMASPVNGEFKRIYASIARGGTNYVCTGTNTAKSVSHMTINTENDGTVTAKTTRIGCDHNLTRELMGVQTESHIYLYEEANLKYIDKFKIEPSSRRLIHEGRYNFKNNQFDFYESKKNNSVNEVGDRIYTSTFVPKELWAKLDDFEQSIDRNEQRMITHKKQEGFNWGKALALGVGAVAGGGLSLDSETQAGVIAGIVLDSQADTAGTSNFNNAVETSLENNARRAAASTSLPSSSSSEATTVANPTSENNTKLAEASPQTAGADSFYTHSISYCLVEVDRGNFKQLILRAHPIPKLIPIPDINVFSDLNSAHKSKAERILRNKLETYTREKGWEINEAARVSCSLHLDIPWDYEDAKPRFDKKIAGDKRLDATAVNEIVYVDVD